MSTEESVEEAIAMLEAYLEPVTEPQYKQLKRLVKKVRTEWNGYKVRQGRFEPVLDWLRGKRQRFKPPKSYSELLVYQVLDDLCREASENPYYT